jgi:Ran GTPase-activating protein (RanGAP) involved in mRNA processing and transport
LDISGNRICGLDERDNGTYDASGLAALVAKSIGNLKELNISNNSLKAKGVEILAPALEANGSLSKLDLSRNYLATKEAGAVLGAMLNTNTSLIVLDLSDNFKRYVADDGPGFASEIANGLEANGSLASVNLLKNSIGVDQASALVKIKESKPNLRTLCGFTLEETELDMSQQGLEPEDAILLASDILDMGSLSKLTFCGIRGDEGDAVTIDTAMTEADFSGKKLGAAGAQILAAFMSTKMFEAKGSLIYLNLAKNDLGAAGAKHVAEVLPKW